VRLLTKFGQPLIVAAVCACAGYYSAAATGTGAQRVAVGAVKFEFSTPEIRVKKGRPVMLELTALDFAHGFSLPDFNVRADLVPGRKVEVTFTPERVGRFVFLCDNFCGEAHDDMSGYLIVAE
jgi:cytochrome c oxidase subunit 2